MNLHIFRTVVFAQVNETHYWFSLASSTTEAATSPEKSKQHNRESPTSHQGHFNTAVQRYWPGFILNYLNVLTRFGQIRELSFSPLALDIFFLFYHYKSICFFFFFLNCFIFLSKDSSILKSTEYCEFDIVISVYREILLPKLINENSYKKKGSVFEAGASSSISC